MSKHNFNVANKVNCLIILITQFMEGKKLTTKEMSSLLDRDVRTCQRYIKYLLDIGLPINQESNKYYYEKLDGRVPFYLEKDKIYMIYIALLSFSAFGKDVEIIESLIEKVELLVAPYDRNVLLSAKANITVKNRSEIIVEDKSLFKLYISLLECFYNRRVLIMEYRSKKHIKEHNVEIYGFCMAKDTYYILVKLIDFDIKSIFRLDRIVQFNETSNTYIIEKDFNIKEYFKHSFEIEVGKEIFDFKLEFYNEGVFNAIERNWFEDQSVILIDKNKAIFEGKTNSEVELTKWILGYGEKVKVIEPIWLREKIKNKYKNALSLYGV